MKFILPLFALISSCLAETLSLSSIPIGEYRASRGSRISDCQNPDGILLQWDPQMRKFSEWSFARPPLLGNFHTLTLKIQFSRTAQSTFSAIAIRLLDKEGEVLQFFRNVKAEENSTVFIVDADKLRLAGSWKVSPQAKINQKIDFPVRLLGMSLYYPEHSAAGELKRLSISWENEKKEFTAQADIPLPCTKIPPQPENGGIAFHFPNSVHVPKLSGGQFRVRLKGEISSFRSAKLLFRRGKQKIILEENHPFPDDNGEFHLRFPVSYELDDASVKLNTLFVELSDGQSLQLQDITWEVPHVALALETGKGSAINVWQQGSTGAIQLRNPDQQNVISGEIHYSLTDESGRKLHEEAKSILLSPGTAENIPLPEPPRFGLYTLTGTLPGKNARPVSFARRFAYLPPNSPKSHGRMQYGIALMSYPPARLEQGALGASLCGADFIRSTILWMNIEKTRGQWNWSYPDCYMTILKKYHLRWAPILWCPPRWATASDWTPTYQPVMKQFGFPRPDYALWTTYVRNCMSRYGRDLRVVEIWNEPDIPGFANFTPEEYAELLKRAYAAIKQEHPQIQVSTCGYTCLPGQHPRMVFPDFMPRSLEAARGNYDIHSIHLHSLFPEYANNIREFLALRKQWNINVPWAANETAVSASVCTRTIQAEILFEKMIFSQAKGAVAYVWHNMIDLGRDPQNKEHNFGLLDNALQPKPAYLAYCTTTRLFRGAELERDLSFEDCFVYLFRQKDCVLVPAWTLPPPAQERLLLFSNITGKAFQIDLSGNRTPLKVMDRKLIFPVTSTPSILLLEQKQLPEANGEFFRQGQKPGVFRLLLPQTIHSIADRTDAGNRPLSIRNGYFSVPHTVDHRQKSRPFLLDFDTQWGKFSVRRFLIPRYELPAGNSFDRIADFTMQDISSFTSTSPSDPAFADCVWKSAADCSAQAWLGWSAPDQLLVKVVVRDDIHFQAARGARIYEGDSIQLLFSRTATGGMWKFGIARDHSGRILRFCWLNPSGRDPEKLLAAIKISISRNESKKETIYQANFPAGQLGITPEKPFRFNLLVNDNDGRCRVGYHSITEVRDDGRNDIGYPEITFRVQ